MAAQDFGQGDGSGYLSTDPYAGMDQGGGYGLPGGMVSFNGGVSGQGAPGAPPPVIQGPGAAQSSAGSGLGPGMTRDQVQAYVQNLYAQRGVTPNSTDIAYWTDRYFDPAFKGDYNYWNDTLNNRNESFGGGGASGSSGGSGGGPGGFGSGWNTLPTADQLKANPGFQYAIDEAQRGMQSSAAAKGTLLNGRTNQAMSQNLANYALGNFYLPLANLGLNYNQANQDNLYRWGQLGLNGSSYGATGKPA